MSIIMTEVFSVNNNNTTNNVSSNQLLNTINNENKENITLIWYDSNIGLHENIEQTTQLRLINDYIIISIDFEQCISFIQSIDNEKIFLIISALEASKILSQISNYHQIDSIFIFNKEKIRYDYLLYEYLNIIGIYTNFNDLYQSIKQQIDIVNKQIQTFSFFNPHEILINDLSKQSTEFLWFQLFKYIIPYLPYNQQAKRQMIQICKEYYRGNQKEMKLIYEFEQNYESKDAIFWYLKKSFIYKLINKALIIKDIDLLYKLRYFIRDLSANFQYEHEKIFLLNEQILNVYRGIKLNKDEFNKLKNNNQEKFISINGYLSTTRQLSLALNFALKSTKKLDMISVLFHIQCDIKQIDKNINFININQYNKNFDEQEILFDFNTCFQIESIDENELIKIIKMNISNEGQKITKNFLELKQKEKEELNISIIFGSLLSDLGEYDKSQKYFEHLLNDSNDEDFAWIEFHIGKIFHLKNKLNEAQEYYNHAYDCMMKNEPARIKDSAYVLHNIGNILANQQKYDEALDYYQRALKINERFYSSDHITIAHVLNNIGNVLANQRKHHEALDYYQRALKMKERLHLSDDVDIAISLSNIGNILFDLRQYDEALNYYQQALKIDEKFYSSNHIHIADSLNYIGMCYENLNQSPMALNNYLLALTIYEKILPIEHPNRQRTEQYIFRLTRNN
ncbi:unnamed protein product [Rotaria sp. Silwood1]|nr:unnamed protein product [Rotaria sp. Silwood1]